MKFILLIRGEDKWAELSPTEAEATIQKYMAFSQKLRADGRLIDADGLSHVGAVLTMGPKGVTRTDGPFAEAKEQVGGYYVFTAESVEEAIAISGDCPTLEYGGTIEVRAVMEY
jgi:hypothetical protein